MSTHQFIPGKKFNWGEDQYEVHRLISDNRIIIQNLLKGDMETVSYSTLVDALFAGDLEFAIQEKETHEKNLITRYPYPDIKDCPRELELIARYRHWVIRPLVKSDSKTRKTDIIERVKQVKNDLAQGTVPVQLTYGDRNEKIIHTPISKASVERWLSLYEKCDCDIRSLIPDTKKQGGKGKSYLDSAVENIVAATIEELYLKREPVTVEDVHHEVFQRIVETNQQLDTENQLSIPSQRTMNRRVAQLSVEAKLMAHLGKDATNSTLRQYGKSPTPKRPGIELQIDHTTLDLIVIDPEDFLPIGRPTFSIALDACVRYPYGYYLGFAPPSYQAVMHCLLHAFQPKKNVRERYGTEHDWTAYGIPRMVTVDNGKEFIGTDLEDACLQLGIEIRESPVKDPTLKARIERFFRTTNTGSIHKIAGTTFSSIFTRGDYNSMDAAVTTLAEIDRIFHIFLLDVFAEKKHRGIKAVPAQRWQAFTEAGFAPRLPANGQDLKIILARTNRRKLQHYGIELECLHYNNPDFGKKLGILRTRLQTTSYAELTKLDSTDRKVKVKYDPGDLSRVHIYDPFEKEYIELPALAQQYTEGLSLWKHQVIKNYLLTTEDRVDIAGLAIAKRKIREIIKEATKRKKTGTRKKIARYETSGKPANEIQEGVITPISQTPKENNSKATPKTTKATPKPTPEVPTNIPQIIQTPIEDLEDTGWSHA